jgi:hypothetical protein
LIRQLKEWLWDGLAIVTFEPPSGLRYAWLPLKSGNDEILWKSEANLDFQSSIEALGRNARQGGPLQ